MEAKVFEFPSPAKAENGGDDITFDEADIHEMTEDLKKAARDIVRRMVEMKGLSQPESRVQELASVLLLSAIQRSK